MEYETTYLNKKIIKYIKYIHKNSSAMEYS